MTKIKSLIASAAFVASSLVIAPVAHAAGSASLAISASSARTVGSTMSVTVVESSGATAVNGVEADLNYDASKMQLIGKSCAGAFEVAAPSGGANLACATVTPQSGAQSVGTLSFKIVAAGSDAISFASSSQITAADGSGTNVWNGSTGGAGFTFAAAAPVVSTPVTATPTPAAATPQVKKAVTVKHAPVAAAPIKAKSNAGWIVLIVASALAILAAVVALLKRLYPKQFKSFVANLTKPSKRLFQSA